ncbi:MAG: zf-HC2 domain-containing protein [Bryobacteraceae bacterium]
MSCDNMHEMVSSLLDRRVTAEEEESVLAHLESCRQCGAEFESMRELRGALRQLDTPELPARLAEDLRLLAWNERLRRLSRASFSARAQRWAARMQLVFDNLMRPMALPIAGGVLSALVMFAILVPSLAFPHNFRNDVPLWMLYTDPALQEMNPVDAGNETVVEVTIDERGRVQGYVVTQGQMTPEIENNLILFSRFSPATIFGQPTWGKVLVSFRRSHQISVRG